MRYTEFSAVLLKTWGEDSSKGSWEEQLASQVQGDICYNGKSFPDGNMPYKKNIL